MPKRFRNIAGDRSGLALVEFAVALPILLVLCLGGFEATTVVGAYQRVGKAAQTIADLVAQHNSVDSPTLSNFCTGAGLVMSPYPATTLAASVASVTRAAGGALTVDWQDVSCGGAPAMASPTTVAASFVPNPGDSVIVVQASYTYTAATSFVLPSGLSFSQYGYARPRNVATVTLN